VALLAAENRAVQDFRWYEENIGPQIPVEVVIHFDNACRLKPLQRLVMVREAQEQINEIDILDGAMSVASFFPNIPTQRGFRASSRRAVIQRQLRERREDLIQSQFLSDANNEESWRISARIVGRKDFDYGEFLDRLRERVSPVIAQYEEAGHGGVTATYTGVTSVVYEVELSLLADLFRSFLTALAIIGLVMIVALRSIRAGLVAMVPNIFPTVVLFGAMGWLERPVDIGTVMTASVALGIAVDGTFHFLKWFRRETAIGKSRREAVGYSFQHCGRALAQTTVICACGLLVYGQSGFLPARHFAWMLLLLLIAAAVGDLVVLPALLLSPLGRLFVGRKSRESAADSAARRRAEEDDVRSQRFDPGEPIPESSDAPSQARVPPSG
jgi:predicted RND superfamily exporter protein